MKPLSSFSPRWILVILATVFTLAGAGVSAWGVVEYRRGQASTNWPTVEGRVTRSWVDEETSTRTEGNRRVTSTMYQARVDYEYEVDGRMRRSRRISFGEYSTSDPADAEAIVGKYPAGGAVKVYYDPQMPERAALEPGVTFGNYFLLGIGLVFLFVGIGLGAGAIFIPWGHAAPPSFPDPESPQAIFDF